jgi:hypothetical protein
VAVDPGSGLLIMAAQTALGAADNQKQIIFTNPVTGHNGMKDGIVQKLAKLWFKTGPDRAGKSGSGCQSTSPP